MDQRIYIHAGEIKQKIGELNSQMRQINELIDLMAVEIARKQTASFIYIEYSGKYVDGKKLHEIGIDPQAVQDSLMARRAELRNQKDQLEKEFAGL